MQAQAQAGLVIVERKKYQDFRCIVLIQLMFQATISGRALSRLDPLFWGLVKR